MRRQKSKEDGVGPAWQRGLLSRPEAKSHGGQAAAPGVMGSRTLLSCKNRNFAGGTIGPDTATAGRRTAALTKSNSTLTLE